MEFTVRGEYQEVQHIDSDTTTLHDPLLTTLLDFDRRALDQLAHALHLTVVHTYDNAKATYKDGFFKKKAESEALDPSQDQAGRDVYYLLKHMHYQSAIYAKRLKQSQEDITETVEFLKDHIRDQMAHQMYDDLKKNQTTERCLAECVKLLEWIINAPFYGSIRRKVQKILNNINNMTDVFEDFKRVTQSTKDRASKQGFETDTAKAIDRLENLLEALREEQSMDLSVEDRPLTHFINMVVGPRLKEERV